MLFNNECILRRENNYFLNAYVLPCFIQSRSSLIIIATYVNAQHTHLNRNDRKRKFGHVRPAKIHISLRIRAVWSESSLCAFWIAKDAKFLRAHNEDSNQTSRMCRLIWVFVVCTCQSGRFHTLRVIWCVIYSNEARCVSRVFIIKLRFNGVSHDNEILADK